MNSQNGNVQHSLTREQLASLSPEQQKELLKKILQAKAERASRFPMSEGQQGLWHAYQRNPSATPFNVFLPTRVRSKIDAQALQAAMNYVAKRHPSLRTVFSAADGKLVQQVGANLLPGFDIRHVEEKSLDDVRDAVIAETLKAFDLEKGPLLKLVLFRLADDDWIILALTHHIIVDFWSLVLIMDELREAYPAFVAGRSPELTTAQANYSKFVQDQSSWLASEAGKKAKGYWQSQLVDASASLELPLDFQRPAVFSGRAATVVAPFDNSLSAKILNLANRIQVTPFAVLHSAIQVFLARYSRQSDFFIGSPFSGRSQRAFEKTVGFFVNMLPIRSQLRDGQSFSALVRQTQNSLLEALEYEAYPISRIVNDSSIVRDPSRSPLFQVSVTYEKAQIKSEAGRAGFLFPNEHQVWDFGGMRQESFYVPHQTCHYDLEFVIEHSNDGFRCMLVYCRDLFAADTMECVAENFVTLLHGLIDQAEARIGSVPWQHEGDDVAQTGRYQVKENWSVPSGEPQTMPGCVSVEQLQDNAFESTVGSVSYREVWDLATKLAIQLRQTELSPRSIVPVVSGKSWEAFVAILGVQLAGHAALPLDADQPASRLEDVVGDTNSRVLVTSSRKDLETAFGIVTVPSIAIEDISKATSSDDRDVFALRANLLSEVAGDDLAYLIYTSGTTGKPKGVVVQHQAIAHTLRWRSANVPLQANDRVLMLLSHQFDAGVGIGWTTLSQGATLVWPKDTDPESLIQTIVDQKITILPAIPSLIRVLLEHPRFSRCTSLRAIWCGGETMPTDLLQRVRETSQVDLWNFYGPTEAAIESAACNVGEYLRRKEYGRIIPIGFPLPHTQCVVVDENLSPIPTTVPGQLLIAGNNLAAGYWGAPDATAAKFKELGGRRFYLTGDLCRMRDDGAIDFMGRIDQQVKLNGYRLELTEIEQHLESLESIERAAVKVISGNDQQDVLQAYVCLANNHKPTAREIKNQLARTLPRYKIPVRIGVLDELPTTTSGKVDRRALPDAIAHDESERIACRSDLDREVLRIAERVLDVSQVGIDHNFFEAGGSSLQAAHFSSQLSQELGLEVTTSLVFDLPDFASLADRISQLYSGRIQQRFGRHCVEIHTRQQNSASHPLVASFSREGQTGVLPKLFMVHPPGGIVLCYRELASELDNRTNLIALRSRGLHGQETLPSSLEDAAADYLEAIRTEQGNGPYRLGGWSLGGLFAYEIAQQLSRDGETVEELLLLDTTIPSGASSLVPSTETEQVGEEYGIEFDLQGLGELPAEEQLRFLWQHAKALGVLEEEATPEVVERILTDLQKLFHHHVALCTQYRMEPCSFPVKLIRPMENPIASQLSRDRGWSFLANNLSVVFSPGHHHSMVQQPHVHQLATHIR